MVDLIQYLISAGLAMFEVKVAANPLNKMVLESFLGELVQQICRQQFMDVSLWKMVCIWLNEIVRNW